MDTAVKPAADLAELSFKVEGMTCASCVARVEKALKSVPGVESASINLAAEKATVRADANLGFDALSAAVEKAGYEVPSETVSLSISGMPCASCVSRVEKALAKVPGVNAASVNLATEKAQVTAVGIPVERLVAALQKAGFEASIVVSTTDSGKKEKNRLPDWWPIATSALLSMPLIAPMLIMPFGNDWALPDGCSGHWLRLYSVGWARASTGPGGRHCSPAQATWTCWLPWVQPPPMDCRCICFWHILAMEAWSTFISNRPRSSSRSFCLVNGWKRARLAGML